MSFLERVKARSKPILFHPAVFIGGFVALGGLFALQAWMGSRTWGYKMNLWEVLKGWCVQYLIWGVICWSLWLWLGSWIRRASLLHLLTRVLPLSILLVFGEEIIWVLCFPNWPVGHKPMTYWQKVEFQLNGEFVESLLIFWCAFFLIRGVCYYLQFTEKARLTQQLEVQLAQAKIQALRMQLNPHFLFNALNSVSSLMRVDISGADTMLEQLSTLLRITLKRRDVQLIPLIEEIDFVEMYIAIQSQRFAGRATEEIAVDPEVYDALVPAMILQPIIENAYAHGISKVDRDGLVRMEACRDGGNLRLSVISVGSGLNSDSPSSSEGHGMGLENVQNRLRLHYGESQKLSVAEIGHNKVQVTITIPLQLSETPPDTTINYGMSPA